MRKFIFFLLILSVIAIGLLHFFTPAYLMLYHGIYRRLSYFPIVIGALLFGVKGGLTLAILSSIAFIPHLLLYMGMTPETYVNELMEIFLYLAAGVVTGFIAGREMRLREKYRGLAEKLKKSYNRLHRETGLLLEAESQLAASQKFSALGQLSASLAHEIKNPLSSIRGTAEIFLDEFPEGHPKREFVEILLKEASRLNSTVEEVLKYSRGQDRLEGQGNREPLADVLARVAKLLETHLRKKAIDLRIGDLEAGLSFPVEGDKLSQVFLNIILNSIDALPQHGTISLTVEQQPEGLAVLISDNGPGIPESDQERIFDPFVTGKEDGTGLGLSISKKIVESYGGTITCGTTAQGGASFTVFLPAP